MVVTEKSTFEQLLIKSVFLIERHLKVSPFYAENSYSDFIFFNESLELSNSLQKVKKRTIPKNWVSFEKWIKNRLKIEIVNHIILLALKRGTTQIASLIVHVTQRTDVTVAEHRWVFTRYPHLQVWKKTNVLVLIISPSPSIYKNQHLFERSMKNSQFQQFFTQAKNTLQEKADIRGKNRYSTYFFETIVQRMELFECYKEGRFLHI